MFKHILVPVDGSAHATRAVQVAADLTQHYGAELTLIHVLTRSGSFDIPPELKSYTELEHVRITVQDIIERGGNEILKNAEILAHETGVTTCQTILKSGNPATCITDYAKDKAVDLIVMGRRGLGDLSSLLRGSVSHNVAQATGCDCLTVKAGR